jgi:hypothetical protein
MKIKSHLLPTNVQVGRVTPCAPFKHFCLACGAHGVTRPTSCAKLGALCDLNRGILSLLLLIIFAVCLPAQAASRYAERELLVKWKDGPDSYAAAVGNAQIGSIVKRNFNEIGWQHVKLPPGMSVFDAVEAYRALGTVLAVEPNGSIQPIPAPPVGRAPQPDEGGDVARNDATVRTPRLTIRPHGPLPRPPIPNDPMFSQQWYLKKIGAADAWVTTTGSTNIVVAVIDTGVDYTHRDLAANMWRNPGETGLDADGNDKTTNGIDDDGNGYVDDVYGIDVINGTGNPMDLGTHKTPTEPLYYHGTFIAGLIGAVGNNDADICGLNWSVQIMAIRHDADYDFTDPLYSHRTYWSVNLAAWDYILEMKKRGSNIRVTSNSYGQRGLESIAVREAIEIAGREGILSVFTGGNRTINEDLYATFPASFNLESAINVTASTPSDALASFANYGQSTVHLAAPGVNMISIGKSPGYATGDGGSYACPLVAGAAALLLSANPNLTVKELKAAILASVDQPPAMRGKLRTNGRLNVAHALKYLTETNSPAIVIHASPAGQPTSTNAPIEVTFSRSMDRGSVESSLIIYPPLRGIFEWSKDSRSLLFRHDVPFDSTTNYTLRILGSARDLSGETLDGNFDRIREGSPADDFVWTFRFRIGNDDFENAQWLTGMSGSIWASNRYAWLELDEPPHVLRDYTMLGNSVWYRWTAPQPGGWFTFDLTSGTAFDSLLAVYTGEHLEQLVAVADSDNYGSKMSSRVSFVAPNGANFSVIVASKDPFTADGGGNFNLTWYPTPPPGFTGSQFSPSSAVPGTKVTLIGTNFTGATAVFFNGTSAAFTNSPTNNIDLRITAVVPADATSGPITIVTPHGSATSPASFQVLPPALAIRLTGAKGLEIAWPATSPEFLLETSEDLVTCSWTAVTGTFLMANGATKLTLSAPAGKRFYRLKRN